MLSKIRGGKNGHVNFMYTLLRYINIRFHKLAATRTAAYEMDDI